MFAFAVPLGLLIGLSLGALGGGGSILAVPALVYGMSEAAHAATTTSLVAVGATAVVGMIGHWRAGRVRFRSGALFGLVGIGGSLLGSWLNRSVPNAILLLTFSVLILVAAWRMHSRHTETPCHSKQLAATGPKGIHLTVDDRDSATPSAAPDERRHPASTVWRVVVAGTVVGFLTGFFGVGGGFVIVPALVLALSYPMPVAVGTSLLVIAISSVEGLAVRLPSETVDWKVCLPFTAAAIVGVVIGDLVAGRVPAARLNRWFVWLLVAVACYTAVRSVAAM